MSRPTNSGTPPPLDRAVVAADCFQASYDSQLLIAVIAHGRFRSPFC